MRKVIITVEAIVADDATIEDNVAAVQALLIAGGAAEILSSTVEYSDLPE